MLGGERASPEGIVYVDTFRGSWILILVWLGLYCLDNYLTIYVARLYDAQDPIIIRFEGGYELTPQFKLEVDRLRLFGPRFIRSAVVATVFLCGIWWLVERGWTFPQLYPFAMGAVTLLAAVVNLRHVQNITFFRYTQDQERPQGQIYYPHAMIYRGSAIGFAAHAIFFLLLALLLGSWFFAGGVCTCAVTAWRHRRLARKLPEGDRLTR
jgi:hypothetical protein